MLLYRYNHNIDCGAKLHFVTFRMKSKGSIGQYVMNLKIIPWTQSKEICMMHILPCI